MRRMGVRWVGETEEARRAPMLQGAQQQVCGHAQMGGRAKGTAWEAGEKQHSWGPSAGWASLLPGESPMGWQPWLGDPGTSHILWPGVWEPAGKE